MSSYNLNADFEDILATAAAADPGTRLLLTTVLNRYQVQLKVLADLQADLRTRGSLVVPPGSRSKRNLIPNPSIAEYSKASSAANATAKTLLAILGRMDPEGGEMDDGDVL